MGDGRVQEWGMARIIVFGATGYTGGLTAQRLAADKSGAGEGAGELVLAGRSRDRLDRLAGQLTHANPGCRPISVAVAVADVGDPRSVRALVADPSDVLISTVGPFFRWGRPAVEAVIEAGATYIDSTGEPAFIERVFIRDGPRAKRSGARLLPAFGYDYVPGNLAGILALRDAVTAGTPATRVEVGYFMRGGVGMSSGTAATGAGIILEPSYTYRGGKLQSEPAGRRVHTFDLDGAHRDGISLGATEHFGLPNLYPQLQAVGVYVGATGKFSRPMSYASRALAAALRVPGVKAGIGTVAEKTVKGSRGGPDAAARSGVVSVAVAQAFDAQGHLVSHVVVEGPSPYDLTADALAWAALNAESIISVGALAPTDAFELDFFVDGCASFGLGLAPTSD